MSLTTASILKDGTVATTGGTAKAFTSLGNTLNQHKLFFDGTDYLSRLDVAAVVKEPKVSVSAPNGYTQARSTITIKSPLTLDNGNLTYNTLQISFACDVETTQAEKQTLLVYGAQLLADSDFTAFWEEQSVA